MSSGSTPTGLRGEQACACHSRVSCVGCEKEKHFFCDIWIFQFFDGKNAVEKKRLNLACLTGISILLSSTILQITGKNVQPSWPESP